MSAGEGSWTCQRVAEYARDTSEWGETGTTASSWGPIYADDLLMLV